MPGVHLNVGSAATSAVGPGSEGWPPPVVGCTESNLNPGETAEAGFPARSVIAIVAVCGVVSGRTGPWVVTGVPSQAPEARPEPPGSPHGECPIVSDRNQPAAFGVPTRVAPSVGATRSTAKSTLLVPVESAAESVPGDSGFPA
jgi:hypothetical protein